MLRSWREGFLVGKYGQGVQHRNDMDVHDSEREKGGVLRNSEKTYTELFRASQ